MSRRLSKKSRATKLATNVAFSAANLPKLESSVLDALFARSPARKRSLRASLMVGTVLSAGILAGVGVLVDASPAFAVCTPSGNAQNCSGAFPAGIGPFLENGAGNTGIINVTTATVGKNATGDGLTFYSKATGQTLIVNTDAASTFGIGAAYTLTRNGINMYSSYTGTTLSVSNAAAITAAANSSAIRNVIVDGFETQNDHIAIINSGQLNGDNGIEAEIYASVPSVSTVTNTIAITNSGQIGTSKTYTGADGIYSLIDKTGFVFVPIQNPGSITGINNQYNSKNIYSVGTSQYAGTVITDVIKGGGFATSGITNSGNLISKVGDGLQAVAHGDTFGLGSGTATVVISNTGNLTALSQAGSRNGIYGRAISNTDYTGSTNAGTITGGSSIATVTIGNSVTGTVTTGSAGNSGGAAIDGRAYANDTARNNGTGAAVAKGGTATATISVSNAGNLTTLGNNTSAYGIMAISGASANAYGNNATGGTAERNHKH